ncbi:hypothetical protein M514_28418, partial [Trichuris suis]
YLGVDFNPFGRRRDQVTGARALLDRVCKAELKPQQKIELIRSHVLPRFLYTLTVGNPVSRAAAQIDVLVRQAVKRILHLPVSTLCNDFIFLPKKHGGLGFICLQDTADFTTLKLLLKMSRSSDLAAQCVSELYFNQRRKSRLMRRQNVFTFDEKGLHAAKEARAAAHEARFLATYQGIGYKEFRDKHSNEWITGERMTGHNFIAAIKARTSLVPTRLQTHRGRADPGDQRVKCRKCGAISGASESLSHISQNCAFTGGLIVRRHNDVLNKLIDSAEASGFHPIREPVIRLGDDAYKPDLLLSKDNSCWVLDVAIPWETQDALNRRHADKCRKYERLKEAACKLTETKDFHTGAIVIGARGAWCSKNDLTLKQMNWSFTSKMKSFICLMTLERTLQIINWFMRSSQQLSFRPQHRGRND